MARSFSNIGRSRSSLGPCFGRFMRISEQNRLYVSDVKCGWICLNCGYICESDQAPKRCPVCDHDQGYFIRLELSPFADGTGK